jgi:hypothetical protein
MSCAARYSETTSLEFILNPFKFFFTNYVAKIAPYPPPNIPHLETQIRSPTILRSHHSECAANAERLRRRTLHVAASPKPPARRAAQHSSLCSVTRIVSFIERSHCCTGHRVCTRTLCCIERGRHALSCAPVLVSSTRGIAIWSTATGAVLHVRSPC